MDYTDFLVDRAQHMRPLEYDLSDNFNELVRYLHDVGALNNLPVGTIGPSAILSASDTLSAPLRSLVVYGNSTQDGTPTPDALVEIVSVVDPVVTFAGKNLFDKGAATHGKYLNANGDEVSQVSWAVSDYISVVAGTQLTISGATTDGTTKNCWYDRDKQFLSSFAVSNQTVTVPSEAAYLRMSVRRNTTTGEVFDVQLEVGTTATAYEPYQGTTVTLQVSLRSLPDGTKDTATYTYLRPSTREGWAWYGGNVERAVGYVADMGELTPRMISDTSPIWVLQMTDAARGATDADRCMCTGYQHVPAHVNSSGMAANAPDNSIELQNAQQQILFKDESLIGASVADVIATITGMSLIYPLATPATETLPEIELPSAVGPSCTIWATADATPTLTAEYVRDLSTTINDMQEAIADI